MSVVDRAGDHPVRVGLLAAPHAGVGLLQETPPATLPSNATSLWGRGTAVRSSKKLTR